MKYKVIQLSSQFNRSAFYLDAISTVPTECELAT